MNKKYLIFSSTIIIILLACFVVGDDIITSFNPQDNEVINSAYNFAVEIDTNNEINNLTFYYNTSGTEQIKICNDTNETAGETSFSCLIKIPPLPEGTYDYGFYAIGYKNDSEGNPIQISAKKSDGIIVDNNPPISTLESPISSDPYWTNKTNITFNCSAEDTLALGNITFYHNFTGIWHSNETVNIIGIKNSIIFKRNLTANARYRWNCLALDNVSKSDWDTNKTIIIDTIAPIITPSVSGTEFEVGESVTCGCTITDDLDQNPTKVTGGRCSASTVGKFGYTCYGYDHAENYAPLVNVTYEVYAAPAEGEGEAESEGEAEGEGEGEPEPKTEEKCWDILEAGATIDYEVDNEEIGIRKITIIPNKALSNTCLKVKQVISITTAGVTKYSEDNKVYKYFQIEPTGISDEDLTSVIIEFSIAKSFFYDHHRDTTNLNRYKEGWDELDTEDLSQDEINYAFFEAESPGFSDFVIVSDKRITGETVGTGPGCGDGICDPDENSTTCCQDCGCALGFECINNSCEKSSKFIVFQWFERAYNDVKEWIEEKIKFDWITNKWWLGLPIWAWIIVGVVIAAIAVVLIFFRKKLKIKLPFEVNFSVHKKKYGFR